MKRTTIAIDWASIDSGQPISDWDSIRAQGKMFLWNEGATIVDLGDGIGLIEFHTKANALNDDTSDVIIHACEKATKRFNALIIGNTGKHFSAGANLAM